MRALSFALIMISAAWVLPAQADFDFDADFMSEFEEGGDFDADSIGETPYDEAADTSANIAATSAGLTASDVAASANDCSCLPASCSTSGAGTCAMFQLNTAALTGMLVSAAQSFQAKSSSGGGEAAAGYNEVLASVPQLGGIFTCQPGTPSCKQPQFNEKFEEGAAAFRKAVQAGNVKLTNGAPPEEVLRQFDDSIGGLQRVVAGPSSSNNSLSQSLGGSVPQGKGFAMSASTVSNTRATGPSLASVSGAAVIRKSAKDGSSEGELYAGVGPVKAFLGRTLMGNGMDLKDNEGKELSLFQRASRRFQGTAFGQQGMRALMLARVEFLRTLTAEKVARFKKLQAEKAAEQARLRAIAAEVAKGQKSDKAERKPASIPNALKARE